MAFFVDDFSLCYLHKYKNTFVTYDVKISDLKIGVEVNGLTVIGVAGQDRHGHSRFEFECRCGQTFCANGQSVVRGLTKSCGCARKEANARRFKGPKHAATMWLFHQYKSRCAKKRGLSFIINFDHFDSLVGMNCAYCGAPPSNELNITQRCGKKIRKLIRSYNGIDRKNNSIGYVPGNVVPCCAVCNNAKSTLSVRDFVLWIHRVDTFLRTCNPHSV